MEMGLPAHYQKEEELKRQRKIHDSLISRGLGIISESYLSALEKLITDEGSRVTFRKILREGKNYEEIVKEAGKGYDLVVLSYQGLGKAGSQRTGSVCSRVARKLRGDLMVVNSENIGSKILIGVDGSGYSFHAARIAAEMGKVLGSEVHLASVYDPEFHTVAFKSIADVLSEEAGKIFKFEEQEKLHDDIINEGLRKLYREYLEAAKGEVEKLGVRPELHLLAGKPRDEISRLIEREEITLVALGRWGFHGSGDTLDMGSTPERLLTEGKVNLLVTSGVKEVQGKREEGREEVKWSPEAEGKLERIPEFARGMARAAMESRARDEGVELITPEFMEKNKVAMG